MPCWCWKWGRGGVVGGLGAGRRHAALNCRLQGQGHCQRCECQASRTYTCAWLAFPTGSTCNFALFSKKTHCSGPRARYSSVRLIGTPWGARNSGAHVTEGWHQHWHVTPFTAPLVQDKATQSSTDNRLRHHLHHNWMIGADLLRKIRRKNSKSICWPGLEIAMT